MTVNPWLPVVQRLARDVAVDAYIHDIDAPRGGGQGPRLSLAMRITLLGVVLLIGAAIGQAVLWASGLRLVTEQQTRLIDAVYRVDAHPERWSDAKLQARLEFRREAIDLIEHTAATNLTTTYPYLSTLTGYPSPLVDPGGATALILLANALDTFPQSQRGHYVQAIVAVGSAVANGDLQTALDTLAGLDKATRETLFAGGAARFKRIVAAQITMEDAGSTRNDLLEALAAKQRVIDRELVGVREAIQRAQRRSAEFSTTEVRCAALLSRYRACLVDAAQQHGTYSDH